MPLSSTVAQRARAPEIDAEGVKRQLATAQCVTLRYETEITPCTGITAVAKQERRHFRDSVMLAPWCPQMARAKDALQSGEVRSTDWEVDVYGLRCRVLVTTDKFAPIIFISMPGRFLGEASPYDTPPEAPEYDSVGTLKRDTLYFGLAVQALLESARPRKAFVWGADWETVPALHLIRNEHNTSLTLHNTFDECLAEQASAFGEVFVSFRAAGPSQLAPTALQVGMTVADVVTTVNRGFAYGMRNELLQQSVMAAHLRPYLGRVVGINNAGFAPLSPELDQLKNKMRDDFQVGADTLFELKQRRLAELPSHVRANALDKAIVVSMGRRVSQKQHDVFVESLRKILDKDKSFPILAVFATVHGDSGSPARLKRIQQLADDFPLNVICEDGRLPYYSALMAAADFNCMPSLYEPHGGAYESTVVPIARAVDGLAEQICGLDPAGEAAVLNTQWHSETETPSGFLFREAPLTSGYLFRDGQAYELQSAETQLRSLLSESTSPDNSTFRAMCDSLADVLQRAVHLRLQHRYEYARLVLAALNKQEGLSWHVNLGGMLSLIEEARIKRNLG